MVCLKAARHFRKNVCENGHGYSAGTEQRVKCQEEIEKTLTEEEKMKRKHEAENSPRHFEGDHHLRYHYQSKHLLGSHSKHLGGHGSKCGSKSFLGVSESSRLTASPSSSCVKKGPSMEAQPSPKALPRSAGAASAAVSEQADE